MKRFPGKVIMAMIILSCGFVMQAEQSERESLKQASKEAHSRDMALNAPDTAKGPKALDPQSEPGSR